MLFIMTKEENLIVCENIWDLRLYSPIWRRTFSHHPPHFIEPPLAIMIWKLLTAWI